MDGLGQAAGRGEAESDSTFLKQNRDGGSLFAGLETVYSNVNEGLKSAFFTLTKRRSETFLVFVLSSAVEYVQLASLVLPTAAEMPLGLPPRIERLATLLSYLRPSHQLLDAFDPFLVVLLTMVLVFLELVALFYVGYSWTKHESPRVLTAKVLSLQMPLYVGMLFVPTLAVVSSVLTCGGDASMDATRCSVLMPVATALLVTYVVVAVFISLVLFDPSPASAQASARPHARLTSLRLVSKALMAVGFTVLTNLHDGVADTVVTTWCVAGFAVTFCLGVLFTWYQPYFGQRANMTCALMGNLVAYLALCVLVHKLTVKAAVGGADVGDFCAENSQTITVTAFGGACLVLPLTWFVVHYRRHTLAAKKASQCGGAFEFELKARLEMQGLGAEHFRDMGKASPAALLERAKRVQGWYAAAASTHPLSVSGPLLVFQAHFLLDFMTSKGPLVRRALLLAEQRGLPLDLRLTAYKTKRLLEANAGSNATDVVSYVKAERLLAEAKRYDRQCTLQLVDFWNELSEKRPDATKVRQLALSIALASASAYKAYASLMQVTPRSSRVFRLFGGFLVDVMNDNRLGVPLIIKAGRLDNERQNRSGSGIDDMNSGTVGVMIVRVGADGAHDAGDILSANSVASKMLNQPSQTIVGHKIHDYLVSPLRERYSDVVRAFIDDGDDSAFAVAIETFLRSTTGACMAVTLKFKPHAADGATFDMYVVFETAQLPEEANYLLVRADGAVVGLGGACHALLASDQTHSQNDSQLHGRGRGHGHGHGPGSHEGYGMRPSAHGGARGQLAAGGAFDGEHVSAYVPNFAYVSQSGAPEGTVFKANIVQGVDGRRSVVQVEEDEAAAVLFKGGARRRSSVVSLVRSGSGSVAGDSVGLADALATDALQRAVSAVDGGDNGGGNGGDHNSQSSAESSAVSSDDDDDGHGHGHGHSHGDGHGHSYGHEKKRAAAKERGVAQLWVARRVCLGEPVTQVFLHDPTNPVFAVQDERDDGDGAGGSVADSMDAGDSDEESEGPLGRRGTMSRVATEKDGALKMFLAEQNLQQSPTRAKSRGSKAKSKASSVASHEVLRSKAMAVRRLLSDSQNAAMDSTLAYLRRLYLRVSVFVCIAVIYQYYLSTTVLADFLADVQLINSLGFRRFCIITLAYTTHSLALINSGMLDSSFEQQARDELQWAAETLKSLDLLLFQKRGAVGGELQRMYEEREVEFFFMRNSALSSDDMSMFDTTLRLVSVAMQAVLSPLSDYVSDSPGAFPLLGNIDGSNSSARLGLETSTDLYTEFSRERLQTVISDFVQLSALLAVMVTLAFLWTLYPLVGNGGKIENVKREILQVFGEIPKQTTKAVAVRYVQRLRDVHDEESESAAMEGQPQPHPNQRGPLGASSGPGSQRNVAGSAIATAKEAKEAPGKPGKLTVPSAKVAPLGSSNDKRPQLARSRMKDTSNKSRCCSTSKLLIVGRMSSLLFLTFVYFGVMLALIKHVESKTAGAPAEANFAGFRRMKSRYVSHELRMWIAGTFSNLERPLVDPESGEVIDFSSSAEKVRARVNELRDIHGKLIYGSDEDFMSGTFRQEGDSDLMDIYTKDGCIGWPATATVDIDSCRGFQNGLLATGLTSAVTKFIESVHEVTFDADVIAAAQGNDMQAKRDILARESLANTFALEGTYLQPQLTTVIQVQAAQTATTIENANFLLIVLLVIFITGSVFIYVFVIRGMLYSLDMEVKRTRSLLLIIPEDVLDSLKHIQVFLVAQFGKAK